jgi:hypothetical protein
MTTSPNRRTIRIEVSHADFAALQEQADEASLPLATYCRGVLLGRPGIQVSRPAKTSVTPAEWGRVLAWVKDKPSRLARYSGPTKSLTLAQRAALYDWAVDHGMPEQ